MRKAPAYRRLRAKMAYEGIEQRELAAMMDRCPGYVSLRMTGKAVFDARDIAMMKDGLNVSTMQEFVDLFFPELEFGDSKGWVVV